MTEMSLFEAIHTQRAIRRYKPDPVPNEAITKILAAATRAPSARNCQPWCADRDATQRTTIQQSHAVESSEPDAAPPSASWEEHGAESTAESPTDESPTEAESTEDDDPPAAPEKRVSPF